MNTRFLMAASAVVLGIIGIAFTFLPAEILSYLNKQRDDLILMQLLGALYFGFAMLNWTAKGNLVGGIYSRPVAISNFTHFFIGGIALIKLEFKNPASEILICSFVYIIFAVLFGYVLMSNPIYTKQQSK